MLTNFDIFGIFASLYYNCKQSVRPHGCTDDEQLRLLLYINKHKEQSNPQMISELFTLLKASDWSFTVCSTCIILSVHQPVDCRRQDWLDVCRCEDNNRQVLNMWVCGPVMSGCLTYHKVIFISSRISASGFSILLSTFDLYDHTHLLHLAHFTQDSPFVVCNGHPLLCLTSEMFTAFIEFFFY